MGQQGQPFDERTIDTIKYFRAKFPDLEIAVDGAVNSKTIPLLIAAGANRLSPGSAVSKNNNTKQAYLDLKKLVSQ